MTHLWLKKTSKSVGILVNERPCISPDTLPFAEGPFLRALCKEGGTLGLIIYIFCTSSVDLKKQQVHGYYYDHHAWKEKTFTIPELIYDWNFTQSRDQIRMKNRMVRQLQQMRISRLISFGVKDKWTVFQALHKHPILRDHLPYTRRIQDIHSILSWLQSYASIICKPIAGSQGKGLIKITRTHSGLFEIQGRTQTHKGYQKHISGDHQLCMWLKRKMGDRKYLIQPMLSLSSRDGSPFDLRVLIQKDDTGRWQETGKIIRLGQKQSFISNMYGGGEAKQADCFLAHEFTSQQTKEIISTVQKLSLQIASFLEQYFGRLFELGIDFGIDQNAYVWILEVNSRPGRSAFLQQKKIHDQSIKKPISYAKYLLDRQ